MHMMNDGVEGMNGNGSEVSLSFDSLPVAPERDIVSMTRTLSRVREILGVSRDDARLAMESRLVGGILPDVNLSQLESLAAAGRARVKVTIETEDGRSLNIALL